MYVCMYFGVFAYVYGTNFTFDTIYVCVCWCGVCVCTCARVRVCTHVCVYACTCECVCLCMYFRSYTRVIVSVCSGHLTYFVMSSSPVSLHCLAALVFAPSTDCVVADTGTSFAVEVRAVARTTTPCHHEAALAPHVTTASAVSPHRRLGAITPLAEHLVGRFREKCMLHES